ncbi:type VI secretion system-associated protein TagF [Acidovorax sp.]|uniref:type VI secretion system-associated protein TagF n=1 Tax=Acidovorax sp. TaxID=1872122 RepID=UPI0026333B3B|nr:type VI secretion system-associated protein TagF [Acidovorax sp.]
MPEQPLSTDHRSMLAPSVAWYGKLPSLGDFAGRRMPHALTTEWDTWLREGMEELRRADDTGWPDTFVNAPLWFFIAPVAALGLPVIGALAPSMDRVGRYYPLTVMATAPREGCPFADDLQVKTFLAGARSAIVDARRRALSVDELDRRISQLPNPFETTHFGEREPSLIDDILSDLNQASRAHQATANDHADNIVLPAGDWRTRTAPLREQSLWWVSPTIRLDYQELLHQGPSDRWLFKQLFSSP